MIPTLATQRLTLRAATMADWPAYCDFYASEASAPAGGPRDARTTWAFFASDVGHWTLHGFGWFTLDDGTGAVGTCGLHHPPHQPEVEIGWNTYARAQRKGYAVEAARAVLAWGRGRVAGRIVSYIDRANAPSQAVARKLGATTDGTPKAPGSRSEVWVHPA